MWGQLHSICKKVCTFVANFDEMPRRETLNNHNTAKIMAETFGRYNIFATLSLSGTNSQSQKSRASAREYTAFLGTNQGRPAFFFYPYPTVKVGTATDTRTTNIIYSQIKFQDNRQ